jgi:hypothetical protein
MQPVGDDDLAVDQLESGGDRADVRGNASAAAIPTSAT